ncbi:unnamed protein product [Linum trigynum]|uniref:Uncharacterized protein n=1 Tax=Linum trigynum TaxID=586398 RepID=A0AAV2GJH2_9ROSI
MLVMENGCAFCLQNSSFHLTARQSDSESVRQRPPPSAASAAAPASAKGRQQDLARSQEQVEYQQHHHSPGVVIYLGMQLPFSFLFYLQYILWTLITS